MSTDTAEHVFVETGRQAGIHALGWIVIFVQQDAAQLEAPFAHIFRHIAAHMRQFAVRRLRDARDGFQQLQVGRAIQIQAIAKALVVIGQRRDRITESATGIVEEEANLGGDLEAVRFAVQRFDLHHVTVDTQAHRQLAIALYGIGRLDDCRYRHRGSHIGGSRGGWHASGRGHEHRRYGNSSRLGLGRTVEEFVQPRLLVIANDIAAFRIAHQHDVEKRLTIDLAGKIIIQLGQIEKFIGGDRLVELGIRDADITHALGRECQGRARGAADGAAQVGNAAVGQGQGQRITLLHHADVFIILFDQGIDQVGAIAGVIAPLLPGRQWWWVLVIDKIGRFEHFGDKLALAKWNADRGIDAELVATTGRLQRQPAPTVFQAHGRPFATAAGTGLGSTEITHIIGGIVLGHDRPARQGRGRPAHAGKRPVRTAAGVTEAGFDVPGGAKRLGRHHILALEQFGTEQVGGTEGNRRQPCRFFPQAHFCVNDLVLVAAIAAAIFPRYIREPRNARNRYITARHLQERQYVRRHPQLAIRAVIAVTHAEGTIGFHHGAGHVDIAGLAAMIGGRRDRAMRAEDQASTPCIFD